MSQCATIGVNEDHERIPYRCALKKGHEGVCDMRLDASVTDDQVKVRPSHYRLSFTVGEGTVVASTTDQRVVEFEVIDVIDALGFDKDAYLTTALIYLMRLGRKDEPWVEVKKAVWYLERWLRRNP